VWKVSGEMYAVEILRIFRMEECKSMTMPMVTNLKKIDTSDSDLVDLKIYKHLIESLMYLVNIGPDICFVVNTMSQLMVEPR
jgi:hypothetical protein